ncbi:MAG TPA: tetratricopeptide repeat protein, partial [Gammaproteobacteria bacterium]|nr:tetratricopeptide repeat protein [Gammaproteobacteria bacterium]
GELLRENGRLEEAVAVYTAALERFPDNAELLYARAMVAERLDRIDRLEEDLRRILANDPDNTQALNALGYTLADRTDRYQEAHELIRKAYEQAPDDPAVIDSMGWVLYRMGRNEEALKHLRRAYRLRADGEIAAHLVEVLWQTGREDEAREFAEQAREQFPEHELLKEVVQRLLP